MAHVVLFVGSSEISVRRSREAARKAAGRASVLVVLTGETVPKPPKGWLVFYDFGEGKTQDMPDAAAVVVNHVQDPSSLERMRAMAVRGIPVFATVVSPTISQAKGLLSGWGGVAQTWAWVETEKP